MYLSSEKDCCVPVVWMFVVVFVHLFLPRAKVSQRQGCVPGHLGSHFLLGDDDDLHHDDADGVEDAGVLVEPGGHRHQSQDVVLQVVSVELRHGLVRHHQRLHVSVHRGESLGSAHPPQHRLGHIAVVSQFFVFLQRLRSLEADVAVHRAPGGRVDLQVVAGSAPQDVRVSGVIAHGADEIFPALETESTL